MSMVYSVSELIAIAGGYLLFLFFVAWITERGWLPAHWVRHPAVYVFSLGVYASAWAVYGLWVRDWPVFWAPSLTCLPSVTAAAWPGP